MCLNLSVVFSVRVFLSLDTAVMAKVSFSLTKKSVGAIAISFPTFHVTAVTKVIWLSPGLAVFSKSVQEVPTSFPWRSRPPYTATGGSHQ